MRDAVAAARAARLRLGAAAGRRPCRGLPRGHARARARRARRRPAPRHPRALRGERGADRRARCGGSGSTRAWARCRASTAPGAAASTRAAAQAGGHRPARDRGRRPRGHGDRGRGRRDRSARVLEPVYAALELDWDPATVGAVADGGAWRSTRCELRARSTRARLAGATPERYEPVEDSGPRDARACRLSGGEYLCRAAGARRQAPRCARPAVSATASTSCGQTSRGRSCPMPGIAIRRASGIAAAVARPPRNGTSGSARPVDDGGRHRQRAQLRRCGRPRPGSRPAGGRCRRRGGRGRRSRRPARGCAPRRTGSRATRSAGSVRTNVLDVALAVAAAPGASERPTRAASAGPPGGRRWST